MSAVLFINRVCLPSQLRLTRHKSYKLNRFLATAARRPPKDTRSPYELVHFRRSRFVAHLNELHRRNALPINAGLDPPTALEQALASAGTKHEARMVQRLIERVARLSAKPSLTETIPLHSSQRFALTAQAMADRVPIIQQAALTDGFFAGYADVLILDKLNPDLGPDARRASHPLSYSVFEIKLSATSRVDYALQAAAYARMLSSILRDHGAPDCRHAFLCLGTSSDAVSRLDVNALAYILQRTTNDFADFLDKFDEKDPMPPIDAPISSLRPWSAFAQRELDAADSLLNIANIRRSQAHFIKSRLGATTLTSFADMPSDAIKAGADEASKSADVYRRLQWQAKLQRQTSDANIAYRVLKADDALTTYGLNRIAPFSPYDVYFDIEGYPLFEEGGLEYLFGLTTAGDNKFHLWWAHTREQEEKAFTALIDWLWTRAESMPSGHEMHIYHYGNYEIAALRRVASRAVTVEGKEAGRRLEGLISQTCFVDIYKAVRNGLMVGERSYSIKKIEKLVGVSRVGDDLADAESSVAMYHQWRMENDLDENLVAQTYGLTLEAHPKQILHDILMYNKQDCESLQQVVAWLRKEAQENGIEYKPIPRLREEENNVGADEVAVDPSDLCQREACGRTIAAKLLDADVIRTCDELSASILNTKTASGTVSSKRISAPMLPEVKLMAHLLHFHTRESGPVRFRFMDRVNRAYCLDIASLIKDHECLVTSKLDSFTASLEGAQFYEFSFDVAQPLSIKKGSSVAAVVGDVRAQSASNENNRDMIAGFMSVSSVCNESGKIVLRSKEKTQIGPGDAVALVRSDELVLCSAPMRRSLLYAAESMVSGGSTNRLVSNFLARKEPFELAPDETVTPAKLLDALLKLDGNAVVIQGPPGCGKTTFSARLISDLLKHGKTVAVSSNSHAAIDNLLLRVIALGVDPQVVCKIGSRPLELRKTKYGSSIEKVLVGALEANSPSTNGSAGAVKRAGKKSQCVALVGATVYPLAKAHGEQKFDYLFVDEASQVSMANFAAMAMCAKSGVLVGDQQQLEMPVQGAHPECVRKSCLAHLVGEDASIVAPSRGVFLDTSFRMQPDICAFVSRHFYNGALRSHPVCNGNRVDVGAASNALLKRGRGIIFVRTDGAASESGEFGTGSRYSICEAVLVARVLDELLDRVCSVNGTERALSTSDILVVSAFNAQVVALRNVVPDGVRVGTVDRFQGQEAPVVIVSTCANVMDDDDSDGGSDSSSRRDLEFSTSAKRLNVAISRASCLAIVIGHTKATRMATVSNLEVARNYALYELLTEFV